MAPGAEIRLGTDRGVEAPRLSPERECDYVAGMRRWRRGTAVGAWVVVGVTLGLALACKSSTGSAGDAGVEPPDASAATSGSGGRSSTGAMGRDDGGSTEDVEAGEALYWMPMEGGNSFSCATCHALQEPSEDGILHPAHALGDATQRPSYKNGQIDEMLDAVNSCLEEWMRVQEPWSASSETWRQLRAFLADQNDGGSADALTYTIGSPSNRDEDWQGGSEARGRALFNTSCAACHGMDARGTVRGPSLRGDVLRPAYVALRVRTSGPQLSGVYEGLTGGGMPFWAEDRLSDAQLLDLAAFVVTNEPPAAGRGNGGSGSGGSSSSGGTSSGGSGVRASGGADGASGGAAGGEATGGQAGESAGGEGGAAGGGGGSPGGAGGGSPGGAAGEGGSGGACGATHARVGQVAQLDTRFHMVSGTATIVDDCTIRLSSFTFDGGGIDVRVYAGLGGNYQAGFAISGDLFGSPRSNDTLTLRLPAGKTLDDLDGISVWCVAVGVDFGSGTFADP